MSNSVTQKMPSLDNMTALQGVGEEHFLNSDLESRV